MMTQTTATDFSSLLQKWHWQDATITPLAQDASFRCYFRAEKNQQTRILMVAPPPQEDLSAFIKITQHLSRLGIRTPEIYQHDLPSGIALLEDIGEDTFTKLLAKQADEKALYQKAIDSLIALHLNPMAQQIDIDHYDWNYFLTESNLFTRWFLPFVSDKETSKTCQQDYESAWQTIHQGLPETFETLVLRDFHVDNLMLKNNQCVLLDYQDALIGSPIYDLVSLLEDARRDIDTDVIEQSIHQYRHAGFDISDEAFNQHYAIWGAQRHCKVAGIFVRLYRRDGKTNYLQHLPRVLRLLQAKISNPALQPLAAWFDKYDIDLTSCADSTTALINKDNT